MNNTGIYRIKSPSGKFYVGMTTVGFETRWNQHIKLLKTQARQHHCRGLQFAYNKYGNELEFAVVELLNGYNESYLLKREVFWWDYYNKTFNGMYNGRPSGSGGVTHTEESKLRLSEASYNLLVSNNDPVIWMLENKLEEFKEFSRNPRVTTKFIMKKYAMTNSQFKRALRKANVSRALYRGLPRFPDKVIEDLPVLSWYFDDNLSTREIARKLGCTQPKVVQYFNIVRNKDSRFFSVQERHALMAS